MNTGRPDTNYGYWFPRPENGGASGWQFMTAKFGRAWIRKDVPRDGLRQRFAVVGLGDGAASSRPPSPPVFRIEVDRDGFVAGAPVVLDRGLRRVAFTLEYRTGAATRPCSCSRRR